MNQEFVEIASRIRELREACGYTQEEMAAFVQTDPETYAGYELHGENVPISVIYEIANRCGVDFTEIITGVRAKLDTYHIVRRGEGRSVARYPGYRFEDLAFRYNKKIMQPLLVTAPADLVSHAGQEFNLVLEGSIAVVFDDKELVLGPGAPIYFNPKHPHGQRCVGTAKARFLTVIAE